MQQQALDNVAVEVAFEVPAVAVALRPRALSVQDHACVPVSGWTAQTLDPA